MKQMSKEEFDPLAYIESAFKDKPEAAKPSPQKVRITDSSMASLGDYIKLDGNGLVDAGPDERKGDRVKFKKTAMSAPRPRRTKASAPGAPLDEDLQVIWETLPRAIEFLMQFHDDAVTSNYYEKGFKETRAELLRRLLDPELSLEEAARLLGVCPATVRRYTNRGWMNHHRTKGGQRRFRLYDVVRFVETHGRFPEE